MQSVWDRVQTEKNNIDAAGKAMAAEQFERYRQKQADLRETFRQVTAAKPKKNEEEEKKQAQVISKERQRMIAQETRLRKHIQQMSKAAKDLAVEYIMQELYYGLSTSRADVPGEFQTLVATGNPQMDSVNHYNIVLACQRHLKLNHPEVFAGY